MVVAGQLAGLVQSRVLSDAAEDYPGVLVTQNAWLLFMLPYSIIVLSIGTPYFTQLSEHAAAGRDDDVRGDVGRSIRTLGVFIVIATAALAAAAVPASRIFTDSRDEAVAAARVLLCFLVSLVPLGGALRHPAHVLRVQRHAHAVLLHAPAVRPRGGDRPGRLDAARRVPRGRHRPRTVLREHRAGDRRDVAAAAASRRAPGRILDAGARPIRPGRRPGGRRRAGSRSCCWAEWTAGPSRTSCSAPSAPRSSGSSSLAGVRRRSSRCCAHPSSALPWRSRADCCPAAADAATRRGRTDTQHPATLAECPAVTMC